eukprot:CAMPEP_0114563862 /NCGR_PEP_ID=MMETSP0114-20121206/13366_1 /TAXON_ID=31324 /ORGANISM="Goniomonas sp, Strain m" /LENGTH=299 /DNA_ID=CAMNT_0001749797 /DNA_START=14 /DNA_END=913 /DNA_ORIENTATION=-
MATKGMLMLWNDQREDKVETEKDNIGFSTLSSSACSAQATPPSNFLDRLSSKEPAKAQPTECYDDVTSALQLLRLPPPHSPASPASSDPDSSVLTQLSLGPSTAFHPISPSARSTSSLSCRDESPSGSEASEVPRSAPRTSVRVSARVQARGGSARWTHKGQLFKESSAEEAKRDEAPRRFRRVSESDAPSSDEMDALLGAKALLSLLSAVDDDCAEVEAKPATSDRPAKQRRTAASCSGSESSSVRSEAEDDYSPGNIRKYIRTYMMANALMLWESQRYVRRVPFKRVYPPRPVAVSA